MPVTTSKMSERYQVNMAEKILAQRNYQIFKEVPLFSSSVDMIILNEKNEIIAIEFKLYNWRKALEQVRKHAISVDYLYICTLKPKTEAGRKNIESTCQKSGVGLFYFDFLEGLPVIEEVVKPKKSKIVWDTQKQNLIQYILSSPYK